MSEGQKPHDFSIDPKHEFAMFVGKSGVTLTPVEGFCSADDSDDPQCITRQPGLFPQCSGPEVKEEDLFVAVKTCSKFHKDRGI